MDKKQKMLLGVLAVVALGAAGSYWFIFRDSDAVAENRGGGPAAVRKERAASTTAERPKTRASKAEKAGAEEHKVAERKEREEGDRKSMERKERAKGPQKTTKKKTSAPMG